MGNLLQYGIDYCRVRDLKPGNTFRFAGTSTIHKVKEKAGRRLFYKGTIRGDAGHMGDVSARSSERVWLYRPPFIKIQR